MRRSELIQRIALTQSELIERDLAPAVKKMPKRMAPCLSDGGRVQVRGFGTFSVRLLPARVGRNPRTGTPVSLSARYAPYFQPRTHLRERLNRARES